MLNNSSRSIIEQTINLLESPKITNDILTICENHLKRLCNNYTFNENEKILVLDVKDSEQEYTDIKIALDDVIELEVGEDLGIVAHLLPHTWIRTNPFELRTSDKNIVDIDGYILTAKAIGSAVITATTLNGKYSDSITVNVVEKYEFTATEAETYYVEGDKFDLIPHEETHDPYDQNIAFRNSNAIKSILLYAKEHGYKKVVFPKDKIYYYDPSEKIYLKNDLIVDFNGCTWQIYPNYFYNCIGVHFEESYKMINLCPRGWKGYESIGHVSYKDTYWKNENGAWVWSYVTKDSIHMYEMNYINGGEDGIVELSNKLYNIAPNKRYVGDLYFIKHRHCDYINSNYTNNKIIVTLLCYKNSELVKTQVVSETNWNKNIKQGTLNIDFILEDTYDYISFKVEGLSDLNYPVNCAISDLHLYEYVKPSEYSRNMILENGFILGDKSLKDAEGNELKTSLFKKLYGSDWRNIQSTEGSMNLEIDEGDHSGCRNMTIGSTCGFNIGIGGGKIIKSYYKDAKTYELGSFDDKGNKIDVDLYARSIEPYEVDITKTPYFIVTDPTFQTTYYFGYRTRIIDLYFYDKDMKYIKSLKGKFRHGIIKAPENTKYIHVGVPLMDGEGLVLNGHGDFSNTIFSIKFLYPINKCFFDKCNILDNYSCGMAHSGMNVLVENCYFNKNIGRMPWADVDSEDGWMRMQNNVFRNNSFNSYYGFIMCSGTNYVLKNNEFNCPVKLWSDTQYYKVYGNTFKNNGAMGIGGLGTSADMYVDSNVFANITVNSECNKGNAKIYMNNNTINGGYLRLAPSVVCTNNKLIGTISLDLFNSSLLDNHNKDYFNQLTRLDFSTDWVINDCRFGMTELGLKTNKTFTFNRCSIDIFPTSYSGINDVGNATFNDCTISNPKIETKFTYNNCHMLNGIVENYIINGIKKEGLIFTQVNVGGIYEGMQDDRFTKGLGDWTIQLLFTKVNNYHCRFLDSNKLSLGVGAGGNSVDVKIFITNDNGNTNTRYMWSQSFATNIGDLGYYVATATYDSSVKKYTLYINSIQGYSYTIPNGYVQSTAENLNIWGQGTIDYYYAYDRVLSLDEIKHNTEILLNLKKDQ